MVARRRNKFPIHRQQNVSKNACPGWNSVDPVQVMELCHMMDFAMQSHYKTYRKLLLNFVHYSLLFRYTLIKTMRLNWANVSVHRELLDVAILQHCSSTEFTIWVRQMLNVHGENGMYLIFLGNLLLKCFLQQNQDIQPYSDNQTKEIKKRCIQNSAPVENSLFYAGC